MAAIEEQESYLSDLYFVVQAEEADQRLDFFLSRRYEGLSRSHFKKLIQDGGVLVNGNGAKPSYEVRPGDRISVQLPTVEAENQLTPRPMPLDILYEDEEVIVVNKAPGIVVHPGAGNEEGALVHGLLAHCPRLALQGAPRRPGIVHRLDRDTSGAIVVAKSETAYLDLVRQFKERTVQKEYLAIVYGRFAQPRGEIRTLMDRHSENRKKMAVVQGKGREAVTRWEVEEELGEVTLLRVAIKTGRTHQIRVHFSYMQHPVVGDETYGGGRRRLRSLSSMALRQALEKVDRQLLHAWRLTFEHPRTRIPVSITAPLASDFAQTLEEVKRLSNIIQ